MKIIHHDDADGRGAAYVVSKHTGNTKESDYIELDYLKPFPLDKISKNEKVYIVDYSFKESSYNVLQELRKITKNIVWIDHHQSSMKLIEKYPEIEEEIAGLRLEGISGMGLACMYFEDLYSIKDCPLFIQYVSDFDCFKFELGKDSEYFILGLNATNYGPLDPIWEKLNEDDDKNKLINELIEKGKVINEYNKQEFKEYLNKYAYESLLEGHKCLVVNRRAYSAIFGDKINDYDLVCSYVFTGEAYMYSIFTVKDDINCGKIAEKFGGGGHGKSSGFVSKELLLKRK